MLTVSASPTLPATAFFLPGFALGSGIHSLLNEKLGFGSDLDPAYDSKQQNSRKEIQVSH